MTVPQQQLDILARVRADLSGKDSVLWFTGNVYGQLPGERSKTCRAPSPGRASRPERRPSSLPVADPASTSEVCPPLLLECFRQVHITSGQRLRGVHDGLLSIC